MASGTSSGAISPGRPTEAVALPTVPFRLVPENHAVGAEDQSAAAPPAALLFALHDGGPPTPGWCRNGVLAEVLPDLASKLHEVGKNGYDSDPLDAAPTEPRVEIVTAHPRNRPMTRDEGRLCKYDRLWIVERCFAWIQQNRRILIRRNCHGEVSLGFGRFAALCLHLGPLYY